MSQGDSEALPPTLPVFTTSDVEIVQREKAWSGFFTIERVDVRHRLYRGGWSDVLSREIFVRGAAVGVLLVDPDRRELVLTEQFRAGALEDARSPWLLELVAGMMEAGESPESVARRETLEETGLEIDELYPISAYYSSPGGSSEWICLFWARVDASRAGGIHGCGNENEDIRTVRLPFAELEDILRSGRLCNAMTLIAAQWLILNRDAVFR
jgi:ADP-ribose pyrophosphatase